MGTVDTESVLDEQGTVKYVNLYWSVRWLSEVWGFVGICVLSELQVGNSAVTGCNESPFLSNYLAAVKSNRFLGK